MRRRAGGDEGGILGDDKGTLQPHNVGMVEGGLCGIGAEEVEGRPEGFEGGVGGRGGLRNDGGDGGGGDEVCRGLVSHPEAFVKMANTLFGDKKLSDLTVVELKMELDKRGLLKKGTKSVLAERLKSFGDPVNIAMRKK